MNKSKISNHLIKIAIIILLIAMTMVSINILTIILRMDDESKVMFWYSKCVKFYDIKKGYEDSQCWLVSESPLKPPFKFVVTGLEIHRSFYTISTHLFLTDSSYEGLEIRLSANYPVLIMIVSIKGYVKPYLFKNETITDYIKRNDAKIISSIIAKEATLNLDKGLYVVIIATLEYGPFVTAELQIRDR